MNYVIGIDLSLRGTGVILLNSENKIFVEALIKTKTTDNPLAELHRLMEIRNSISKTLTVPIKLAVLEGLAFMAHNTTALVQLAGLNYMVREMLYSRGIPFVIVVPTTLKKYVVGKGNAQKDQVMLEVYKRWGFSPADSNVSDAYGLAKIGQAMLGLDRVTTKEQKECLQLLKKQL